MKKTTAALLFFAMLFSTACKAKTGGTEGVTGTDSSVSDSASEISGASESTIPFPADQYDYKYQWYSTMTPEEITSVLTLEQKAAQMVQPISYMVSEDKEKPFRTYCYGSLYADEGMFTEEEWREMVDAYQREAIESEAGIPYLVAQDDVHGVGYCIDAVYFPHNIGIGAANNEELAYQMGRVTAEEAKRCHMLWNLYPCVAQSDDPRWGRNYECYSSDLQTITRLSTAYTKGLLDGGVLATAKHFFGEGNVLFGTGENSDYDRLIDRGDARLTEEEIAELLKVYQAQIDAGVQFIMVSYSSLNGTKMHENAEYIGKLRIEMGFTGVIMSDSMAIQNTSPDTYEEQVISAVNCGIDLLMEGVRYDDARSIIIDAVESGKISMERIDEAVTRIIQVKKDMGLFDDPFYTDLQTEADEVGSMEYRAVAEKLVEESLVLLKNENDTLPLKEGTKVYVIGPASNNPRAQCGGWTMGWNMSYKSEIQGVTTIREAFERYASDYGIEVITDPNEADQADVVLLCVGEDAYAEWFGDTLDLKLCGDHGLPGNQDAINEAKALGKPTVTCIIAGRQVILDKDQYKNWDAVVMCYLPGSEGKGISDVLCGCADFTGRLPEPWYDSMNKIGKEEYFLERGYGLSYGEGFTPKEEPVAVKDVPAAEVDEGENLMKDTNYVAGEYSKSGEYTNEYAGIKMCISDSLMQVSEESLPEYKEQDIDDATDDRDKTRIAGTLYENMFLGDQGEYIMVQFLNMPLGVPDHPDYNEEKYLKDNQALLEGILKRFGVKMEFSEKTQVTISGTEYWKQTCTMDGVPWTWYVRNIDDQVMCIITIRAVEDTDSLFE